MSLVKYNPSLSPLFEPVRDFFDIFDAFDPIHRPTTRITGPRVNVDNADGKHVITMATPGVSKEDLKVDIGDGRVSVSFDQESCENSNHRFQKSFSRTWNLPKDVNVEAIDAAYENGILTVIIPKNEETVPVARRIKIN